MNKLTQLLSEAKLLFLAMVVLAVCLAAICAWDFWLGAPLRWGFPLTGMLVLLAALVVMKRRERAVVSVDGSSWPRQHGPAHHNTAASVAPARASRPQTVLHSVVIVDAHPACVHAPLKTYSGLPLRASWERTLPACSYCATAILPDHHPPTSRQDACVPRSHPSENRYTRRCDETV